MFIFCPEHVRRASLASASQMKAKKITLVGRWRHILYLTLMRHVTSNHQPAIPSASRTYYETGQLSNTESHESNEDVIESESDVDEDSIKSSLAISVSKIKTAGSTAGSASELPIPGLNIEGIGIVGLPLTRDAARRVIDACHQAPYGKGK